LPSNIPVIVACYALTLLAWPSCFGALALGVQLLDRGEEPGFLSCLARGASKIPSYLLLFVVVVLLVFLFSLGLGALVALIRLILPSSALAVGFYLFLALCVFAFYSLAIPVLAIEEIGCLASLDQSQRLTKGHRISVAFFFFLLLAGAAVAWWLIGALVGPEGADNPSGWIAMARDSGLKIFLVSLVVSIPANALAWVFLSLCYRSFKANSERQAVERLADVFE
jgi:hypothetical protein